jgi:hypothetical protein
VYLHIAWPWIIVVDFAFAVDRSKRHGKFSRHFSQPICSVLGFLDLCELMIGGARFAFSLAELKLSGQLASGPGSSVG